jgi:hypothetical protein
MDTSLTVFFRRFCRGFKACNNVVFSKFLPLKTPMVWWPRAVFMGAKLIHSRVLRIIKNGYVQLSFKSWNTYLQRGTKFQVTFKIEKTRESTVMLTSKAGVHGRHYLFHQSVKHLNFNTQIYFFLHEKLKISDCHPIIALHFWSSFNL